MELKDIVSITGMPGLYKMVSQRSNGIVAEPIAGGKTKFVSSRQHFFTPLEQITIYTDDVDGMELKEILKNMQSDNGSIPDHKSDGAVLHDYFSKVAPNYDQERVYSSDIKKIVRWYKELDKAGMLSTKGDEENTKEADQKDGENNPPAEEGKDQ